MRTHAVHPTPGQIREGRLFYLLGLAALFGSTIVTAAPVALYLGPRWWNGLTPARQADLAAAAGRMPAFVGLLIPSLLVLWGLTWALDVAARRLHPRGER